MPSGKCVAVVSVIWRRGSESPANHQLYRIPLIHIVKERVALAPGINVTSNY